VPPAGGRGGVPRLARPPGPPNISAGRGTVGYCLFRVECGWWCVGRRRV